MKQGARRREKRASIKVIIAAGIAGIAGVATVGIPCTAHASPLFELAGAVNGNGGLSARAVESGAASTYFNPALLSDAEQGVDVGIYVLSDQIGIHVLGRPSGSDIPVDSINAEQPGGGRFVRYGIPTQWLQQGKPADPPDTPLRARPRQADGTGHNTRAYQIIGLVTKLFDNRLTLGVYGMIPYSEFTGAAAFYSDEREQYFSNSLHPELYSDRLTATSFAFGGAIKLHEKLSFGISATLGLKTIAATPTYVNDVGHFDDIKVDSKVNVNVSLAPHFGVAYKPIKHLQLTGTVHSPQKLVIGTDFTFLLSNGLEQGASLNFTHAYMPWMFGVGAAYDGMKVGDTTVTLVGTVLYSTWSNYIDRHGETPTGAYGWYDTFSGTVGARLGFGQARALLDFTYQPSPVPDQTGRTSYVDNDRIGSALGCDYKFPLFGGTLRTGLQVQLHRLLPRSVKKDPNARDGVIDEVPDNAVVNSQPLAGREGIQTNSPGYPGFSSAGWIFGGGLNVSFTQ